MVKIETYTIHLTAFIYQPVAAPHQSFLSIGSEVPLDKKSSFPPGEAKNSKNFGVHHSTKHSIAGAAGRQVGDPYRVRGKPLACGNQRGTLPQTARSGCQLPQGGSRGGCAASGRLRASPTGCGGSRWLAATNGRHSLSFAFAQQLPQRGSQGHFVPAGG